MFLPWENFPLNGWSDMRANPGLTLPAVAIETENLKSGREVILFKPTVKRRTPSYPVFPLMFITSSILMVYGQEIDDGLAATPTYEWVCVVAKNPSLQTLAVVHCLSLFFQKNSFASIMSCL